MNKYIYISTNRKGDFYASIDAVIHNSNNIILDLDEAILLNNSLQKAISSLKEETLTNLLLKD